MGSTPYQWVTFYPDTVRYFIGALQFYRKLLESDKQALQSNNDLVYILPPDILDSFPIKKELQYMERLIKTFSEHLERSPQAPDYEITITHAGVRIIKSACSLYLKYLDNLRNALASNNAISHAALEAIDTRLAQLAEKAKGGVFANAEPWPLLIKDFPEIATQSAPPEKPSLITPPPKIASTIELVDPQLRERCLDLFDAFSEGDQAHRFDTVVQEATRILEDRLRQLSGADGNLFGIDLAAFVFKPSAPKLILGQTPAEKEAAHLLFRGVFGLIRNPFHHRLIGDMEKERVVQILGLVDYLIYLAESAQKQLTPQT